MNSFSPFYGLYSFLVLVTATPQAMASVSPDPAGSAIQNPLVPNSRGELSALFESAHTPLPEELGFHSATGKTIIEETWTCQTFPIDRSGTILESPPATVRFTQFLGIVRSEPVSQAWGAILVGKNILAYTPSGLLNQSGSAVFELRMTRAGDLVTALKFTQPQQTPFVEVYQYCPALSRVTI